MKVNFRLLDQNCCVMRCVHRTHYDRERLADTVANINNISQMPTHLCLNLKRKTTFVSKTLDAQICE